VPVPTTVLRSASAPRGRQAATVVGWALTGLAVWALASGLEPYPRLVLTAFALAIFGWVATRIDDSYIALLAALLCAIAGSTAPSGGDLAALGDPLIWLLLGTFVIGAAITASGLSVRIGMALTAQVRSVRQLFYVLTAALTATAFVIPSTTARAAVAVPVFVALTEGIESARIRRALALLIPTVIVLSALVL
jgi:solute carrier family 13 (sodium-dependent dicarboxylate transporter), member 2/3/5